MDEDLELAYAATQWYEMKPDLYEGDPVGSEIKPRFECFCEGDMQSDFEETVSFSAKDFPPGTKITVELPCCPECGQDVETCKELGDCDFDWDNWVAGEYA